MQKFRYGIKLGNGVPTIPVSSNHQNGDWIATDIYEGEMYLDLDTGLTYTRKGTSIIKAGSTPNEDVIVKFRIYQLGTAAPVVVPYFNPYGYTLTTVRDAAGIYRVLGMTGNLFTDTAEKYELQLNKGFLLSGSSVEIYPSTDTSVVIQSRDNTGANADNIIPELNSGIANWTIVTIVRYS